MTPTALQSINTPALRMVHNPDKWPIVIVGNGPAGQHAARQLLKRNPAQSLVIYGIEP